MAGNTGKMTSEAIAVRGPRLVLLEIQKHGKRIGFVIARVSQLPLNQAPYMIVGDVRVSHYAQSYTLAYLRRIVKGVSPCLF